MWQQWINALLGLWTIVVPFLGITGTALSWTLVVTGVAIAVLSLWGIQETSIEREEGRMVHRTPQHQ